MTGTVFTQDLLQGKPVVSYLDVDSLVPGVHQMWFAATPNGQGVGQHVPLAVIKGERAGPKVMVTAGVHGDELNGVLAAQQLIQRLSRAQGQLAGSVLVLPTINVSGIEHHTRDFIVSDPDASTVNLNRCFPGKADGDAAQRYLASLWRGVLAHNADVAVDLHTQTRGTDYPLYVFADFRSAPSLRMARLMNPDCILDDAGDHGVLETELNRAGIPCITVEIGTGKLRQSELIHRALDGLRNVLVDHGVLSGEVSQPDRPCFEGAETCTVRAELGGFAEPQVIMGQHVTAGELVSIQSDAFGNELKRYYAPHDGLVLSLNLDPMREPGSLLVRLIY